MTVTLSKRPGRQKRGPPGRGYIPDRPPDGYHVTDGDTDRPFARRDFAAAIATALTRIEEDDQQMSKLETRINRITARLHDPDLLDEIPVDDPRRLEAEDLRDELTARARDRCYRIERDALMIENDARLGAARGVDLQSIDVTPDVVMRLRALWPAVLRGDGWQALLASDCPF